MLWDTEFSNNKWDYLDPDNSTARRKDIVYDYVEKYSANGAILDLGCGTGKIGREINVNKYTKYVGVDISTAAIQRAKEKCAEEGQRISKNEFQESDILKFASLHKYEVILFQESLQYFNKHQIRKVLWKYAHYLSAQGVIIIRLCDRQKYAWIINFAKKEYQLVDAYWPANNRTAIIVLKQLFASARAPQLTATASFKQNHSADQ